MVNAIEVLKSRGLFEDVTSPEVFTHVDTPTTVYAGFDPTSNSLQVGNFVTIMGLAHFQRCGHRAIALAGGATGMIGDPSGKDSERKLLSPEEVNVNLEGIRENLSRFLDFEDAKAPARIVNNHDWIGKFSYIDFLRDIGKHFRMGAMLGKESVRARMESEAGMSYCEFSYQLIQAYDFLHLWDTYQCRVQIGGSDQWGNITAGTELIRRLRGGAAYGVTFPIICDNSGQKFGKSAGNSVYLDQRRTSCYDFYQFFMRIEDADVIRFLKIFTFLPLESIAELEREMLQAPERRLPQKRLAEEVTRMVHGAEGVMVAQRASEVLFGGSMAGMRAGDLLSVFANVPSMTLAPERVLEVGVVDVATACGLCKSKSDARRLIADGGFYVNNVRVSDAAAKVRGDMLVDGCVMVLRAGKKHFCLVRLAG